MSKASEPLSGLFNQDYIIVCMVFLPLTFSAGVLGGSGPFFLCLWFWIITNSYFIFFYMFICQNVGNFKGFLLICQH